MLISDLTIHRHRDGHEVTARVAWEARERPDAQLFFRFDTPLVESQEAYADAFLIACSVPAMVFGEPRLSIDTPVCPGLKRNLPVALAWINHWFAFRATPLPIEAVSGTSHRPPPERVAAFFTGGIDSWATLAVNRQHFPSDHAGRIRDCIMVHGLQGGIDESQFRRAVSAFESVADDLGVRMLPITTNSYAHWMDLDPGYRIWSKSYNAAVLASVAHALPGRFSRVLLAASDHIGDIEPWGTHPFLDHYYSSYRLPIANDGIELTRLNKTRLVADWPLALANLRVCDSPIANGYLNCGTCEKCVRTMLTLEALGRLAECPAFPERSLTRERLLAGGNMSVEHAEYLALVPELAAHDRDDLVDGVRVLERQWRQRDWRGWIKRADRILLGGTVGTAIRRRRRANQRAPIF